MTHTGIAQFSHTIRHPGHRWLQRDNQIILIGIDKAFDTAGQLPQKHLTKKGSDHRIGIKKTDFVGTAQRLIILLILQMGNTIKIFQVKEIAITADHLFLIAQRRGGGRAAPGLSGWRLLSLRGLAGAGTGGAGRAGVAPGWTVQSSVQEQLRAELTGTDVAFSLVSAQATRLDQGGRRFDGAGLAQLDGGEVRFVSFSLSVDPDGRVSAFDYGMATSGETDDVLAVR